MSRHALVRMVCLTTGRELLLESGLEADLVRDRDVVWMVAQPVKLTFW